jgi:predicted GIY-YIG superfamily endonuclease
MRHQEKKCWRPCFKKRKRKKPIMRPFSSLLASYEYLLKKCKGNHHGLYITCPLTSRQSQRHDQARFGEDDFQVKYAGPLIICKAHPQTEAPSECLTRARAKQRVLGAQFSYPVWKSAELPLFDGGCHDLAVHHEIRGVAIHGQVEACKLAVDAPSCSPAIHHRISVIERTNCDSSNSYCVYLLQSIMHAHVGYLGICPTSERSRRLAQHNGVKAGGAKATKLNRPWRMVGANVGYATRAEAEFAEARAHKSLSSGGPTGIFKECERALTECVETERGNNENEV